VLPVPSHQGDTPSVSIPDTDANGGMPCVRDVAYANGRVSWRAVPGALQYEVQVSGPFEEKKDDRKEAKLERVYQVPVNGLLCSVLGTFGSHRIQVRAQMSAGWGPFSEPLDFKYVVESDANKKSSDLSLISIANGRKCVVSHDGQSSDGWLSVLSSLPLFPSMSSEGMGKARFEVKVDKMSHQSVVIGVCSVLPVDSVAGGPCGGVGYDATGSLLDNSTVSSGFACYGVEDVILVEVDFEDATVSFLKNGEMVGKPVDVDVTEPLYAAVSTAKPGNQLTLLGWF